MSDQRPVRQSGSLPGPAEEDARNVAGAVPRRPPAAAPVVSDDTKLAVQIRELAEHGQLEQAREKFGGLVAAHQRRALRIAYQYLRDAADADEAVQDAFVKVFNHIGSYREAWPFEV